MEKGKEEMDKKYDISKSHVYICSNCGYESIYKLPREVAERMGDLPVQTLKRECPKCNEYVTASRGCYF